MASKPVADLIRDLQIETARLTERLTFLRASFDEYNSITIRERLAVVDSQLGEIKKREEERDRQKWQVTILFFGSLLTLALQLTVLFLKK